MKLVLKLRLVILSIILTGLALSACHSMSGHKKIKPVIEEPSDPTVFVNNDSAIIIKFADSLDGRATYNVFLPNQTSFEHMYAEEIAQSLINGEWGYEETTTLQTLKQNK